MTHLKLINQSLLIIIFILSLANIYFVAREFKINYEGRNGIVLKNGMTLGGDFMAFYTGANLYNTERHNLYNYFRQKEFQENFPGNTGSTTGFLQFVYPPLFATVISPLAKLSFENAYFVWAGIMLLLYSAGIFLFLYNLKEYSSFKYFLIILGLGFPPFILWGLAGGQSSAIGVFFISAIFHFFNKRNLIVMAALSLLLLYKPPLFMFFILFLSLWSERKYTYYILLFGLTLILINLLHFEKAFIISYFEASLLYLSEHISNQGADFYFKKGAGLSSIINSFMPINSIFAKLILFLVNTYSLFVIRQLKHNIPSYLIALTIFTFTSYHLVIYDSSILIFSILYLLIFKIKEERYFIVVRILLLLFYLQIAWNNLPNYGLSFFPALHLVWVIFAIFSFSQEKFQSLTTLKSQ